MNLDLEPLWTWREVAAFLRVGRSTVFNLAAGDLPCLHVGRQLRFDPAAVSKWALAQGGRAQLKRKAA